MQFESAPPLSTKGACHASPGHRAGLVCGDNKALKRRHDGTPLQGSGSFVAVPQGVALGWYDDGPLALWPTQVKAHAVFQ
jgi:hypothetical protein